MFQVLKWLSTFMFMKLWWSLPNIFALYSGRRLITFSFSRLHYAQILRKPSSSYNWKRGGILSWVKCEWSNVWVSFKGLSSSWNIHWMISVLSQLRHKGISLWKMRLHTSLWHHSGNVGIKTSWNMTVLKFLCFSCAITKLHLGRIVRF